MTPRVLAVLLALLAGCSSSTPPKHPPAKITFEKKPMRAQPATPAQIAKKPSPQKLTVQGRVDRRCRISDQAAANLNVKLLADDEPLTAATTQRDGTFFLEAAHNPNATYDLEVGFDKAHLPEHRLDYHVELLLPCADPAGRVGYEPPIALKLVAPAKTPQPARARLNNSELPRNGERIERVPADQAAENPR